MAEPLKVTANWQSYTPTVPELIQNTFLRGPELVIQVVQGALSVAVDADIGALADVQGTFLRYGESMPVQAETVVQYRTRNAPFGALGRN